MSKSKNEKGKMYEQQPADPLFWRPGAFILLQELNRVCTAPRCCLLLDFFIKRMIFFNINLIHNHNECSGVYTVV